MSSYRQFAGLQMPKNTTPGSLGRPTGCGDYTTRRCKGPGGEASWYEVNVSQRPYWKKMIEAGLAVITKSGVRLINPTSPDRQTGEGGKPAAGPDPGEHQLLRKQHKHSSPR